MVIMDCTLRDGANVVGDGFSKELTQVMLDGLTAAHVPIIEMGNAKGLGAYEISGARAALTDLEYMELAQPYLGRAQVGMFLNASRFRSENVAAAGEHGLSFLRVGSAAGDGKKTEEVIACVKKHGMKAFYSQMKAYLLPPEELAEEAALLESFGADEITIMDSAGTMVPEETARYVAALKEKVRVPVGFHGHNNLGMAAANALAAYEAGADIIDCGLLGMARSAGNIATEIAAALLVKYAHQGEDDFYGLLSFLDRKLIPLMEKEGYRPSIRPLDLVYGLTGAHSSFGKRFKAVAEEKQVDLFRLIAAVSAQNRKNPSEELMRQIADRL